MTKREQKRPPDPATPARAEIVALRRNTAFALSRHLGRWTSISGAMPRARTAAEIEANDRAVIQAQEAFLEHWNPAEDAMRTMLKAGDAEQRSAMLGRISMLLDFLVLPRIEEDPDAGNSVFTLAQTFCKAMMNLATDSPPTWLVERARSEYIVPWLMVNGKPAPGFGDCDAKLHWGCATTKRGKSPFDTPQANAVAAAIKLIITMRQTEPAVLRADAVKMLNPWLRKEWLRVASLPALSRETKPQWWLVVREHIRNNVRLTEKEKETIRRSLDPKNRSGGEATDAAVMNAFINDRCKKTFEALCPAE